MAPALPQPRSEDGVLPPRNPGQRDPMAPSPAVARDVPDRVVLAERQTPVVVEGGFTNTLGTIVPVPATYGGLTSSPAPGAVAGIVLGSVVGFLLLLALIYTCCSFGPAADSSSSWATPSAITLRTRGRHRSSSRHRHRSRQRSKHRVSRVSETVEVRSSSRRPSMSHPNAIIVDAIPDHDSDEEVVVVRDGRRRSISRPIAVPVHAPRVVHDSDDDEVVVVEEHSPPPRRSSSRRASGAYRDRESRRYSRG